MDAARPASPRGVRRHAPQPPSSPDPSKATRGHQRNSSRSAGGVHYDAAVEELCRIETFQQGFSSKDFLAGLSEKLIARSKADPGPFNPRPFIRTFESSVDALLALRQQLTGQMTSLSSSVRVSESAYTSKLHDLSSHFSSVNSSFSSLESRFSEVGRTAMHIGEQLQTIDRMRTRAAEAHDLIEYYYQFARGDTSRLERLRKEGGRDGRLRTAVIARRLGAIAREVDIPGAEQTRETIDKFAERFERDMLKLFDRFYRKSDPKMMSHIAKVLQSFNGGHSCIQIYVNQHDFFISKDRVGQRKELEQSRFWDSIADPDAVSPKSERSLQALFDEIRSTVEVEAQIISAVFPNPLIVMTTFLQRVFAQSVQGYVEVLMDKASEVGTSAGTGEGHLAFLRALQMARSMCLTLVNDLKVYDFRAAGIPDIVNGTEQSNATGTGGMAAAGTSLGIMLDQAVEELFVPYMEGVKYLDRESRNLTELYAAYLLRFSTYHRTTHQTKAATTLFDRVRVQVATQQRAGAAFGLGKLTTLVDRARVAAGGTATAPIATSETSTLVDGRPSEDTAATIAAEIVDEQDGVLSLDVAERMLRWHAEAIGRCVDLSTTSSADVAKNTFALLKVLAEAYVKLYVETALDSAYAHAQSQDARGVVLPELGDLLVVRQAELIMQLWQHYVNTALLPLGGASVTVRREMVIYNNHLFLRVEKKCDSVLQKITDNVVQYLSGRLSTQKKNDFTPKNDELAFSRINTDPCLAICDALEKIEQAAKTGLGAGNKNCDAFLLEVGVAFHGLLLDHCRKFTISAAGGIMLTKDLAMYQDAIAAFGISALSDRFEMLRQLGNLFIVQPAVLQSYMRESHLAKVEERLLRPYLLKRADYATAVRDLGGQEESKADGHSDSMSSSATGSAQASNTSGLNDAEKIRRLSSVMQDLERFSRASGSENGPFEAIRKANDAALKRVREEEEGSNNANSA